MIVCVPTPVDESRAPDLEALRGPRHGGRERPCWAGDHPDLDQLRRLHPRPGRRSAHRAWLQRRHRRVRGLRARAHRSRPRPLLAADRPARDWWGLARLLRRAAEVIGRVAPVHTVSSAEAAEFDRAARELVPGRQHRLRKRDGDGGDVARAPVRRDRRRGIDQAVRLHALPCRRRRRRPLHPVRPPLLLWQLRRERLAAPVLQRAMEGIAARPGEIVDRAIRQLADEGIAIRGASVLIVGVAYKPGVEDMRESPAIEVIERLRRAGADVHYTDALIPAVHLPDGVALLLSVADPSALETDLVIVHSMHPGVSHDLARRTPGPGPVRPVRRGPLRRRRRVRRSVRPPLSPWTAPSLDAPDPSPVERRLGSAQAALRLARNIRGRYLLAIDLVGIVVAAYVALALRLDRISGPILVPAFPLIVVLLVSVRTAVNIRLGLYSRRWRFASVPELERIVGRRRARVARQHGGLLRDVALPATAAGPTGSRAPSGRSSCCSASPSSAASGSASGQPPNRCPRRRVPRSATARRPCCTARATPGCSWPGRHRRYPASGRAPRRVPRRRPRAGRRDRRGASRVRRPRGARGGRCGDRCHERCSSRCRAHPATPSAEPWRPPWRTSSRSGPCPR